MLSPSRVNFGGLASNEEERIDTLTTLILARPIEQSSSQNMLIVCHSHAHAATPTYKTRVKMPQLLVEADR